VSNITLRLRSEQRNRKGILQDWFPVEFFPLSAFGMKETIAIDSVGKAEFPAISRETEHPPQTNFSRGSPRQLATTLDAEEII
jgi:hypothetical protein